MIARVPALRDRMIVATGDVRPATEETLTRLGVRYVRKPFNLRDLRVEAARLWAADRKSTRLNSSHSQISYAVFCLKKKNINTHRPPQTNTHTEQCAKRNV